MLIHRFIHKLFVIQSAEVWLLGDRSSVIEQPLVLVQSNNQQMAAMSCSDTTYDLW